VTRILVSLLLFSATAHGRNFSGFFTPEVPSGQRGAPIPVSASASIELAASVSGNLRLRELGEYRLEGSLSDGKLELRLHQSDSGAPAGHAVGTVEGTRVELTVEFLDREGATRSRGRLELEGAAEWRASPVTKSKGLRDQSGRQWFETEFDDVDWEHIELPDDNSFGDEVKHARFYRSYFHLRAAAESLSAVFSSDDGIWIYVNGRPLGHWGARENRGGCVNDPLERCGVNGTVQPVPIPQDVLVPGRNVVAVKVNNGECCFTYFNLLLTRVSARVVSTSDRER
jgi:hypothetical protein